MRVHEDGHSDEKYSTTLGFAHRLCTLNTNSPRLMDLACAFFSPCPIDVEPTVRASITLLLAKQGNAFAVTSDFPIFRGRNEFVHADYGSNGSVWFNLKTRDVAGTLSERIVANEDYFRRAVLGVIAGVLAPSLGVLALHAGCVARNGRAVLLAAPSGTGKSTISLALGLRGWSLLSDDWTFVADTTDDLIAWGMQTSIKLLPDASIYFPELAAISPAISLNGELSFEIDPWSFFGAERSVVATPSALVFLKRDPMESNRDGCDVLPFCEDDAMKALLEEIEEQPAAIADATIKRTSVMKRLCRLPSVLVRLRGSPSAAAAELDEVLAEYIHA